MTDKELLELAAKAAGIIEDLRGGRDDERLGLVIETKKKFSGDDYHFFPSRYWNPLTSDGDALRLAVKLHINIEVWNVDNLVRANIYILHRGHGCFEEHYTTDPYAATRRAIVRAAAEIGKEMK